MLEAYAAAGKQGHTVAWDTAPIKGKKDGAKAYAHYDSIEAFYASLLQNPPDKRFGYELIPENTPCKAYGDIEWIGEPDPNHALLTHLIKFFRKRAAEWYSDLPGQLEVFVTCSSRPAGGELVKHSYHVIINNLVFSCNHDDQMKLFFTLPGTSDVDSGKFYWTDTKGESKCVVDTGVYDKNRAFRLSYNMKRGSTTPFLRLSNDPYEDDFTGEYSNESVDDVLPMVLTTIEPCADTYFVKKEVIGSPVGEPANKKRKRDDSADACGGEAADERPRAHAVARIKMPVSMEALKSALEGHGDDVSRPSSFDVISTGQTGWAIQCNQGGRSRQCLVDPTKTHDSNNLLLFVRPQPNDHIMRVECHCTAESCKRMERVVLGKFELNQWCQWEFVKQSSQDDPMAVEVRAAEEEPHPLLISSGKKEECTYAHVKTVFECKCFRVESPYVFVKLPKHKVPGEIPDILSVEKVKSYFADVHFWEEEEDKQGNKEWVAKSFIHKWLQDPFKREVKKIVVDPRRTLCGVYNLWEGYLAEALTPVPDDKVEELVEPIISHIREVIANGNEGHTNYLIDWIANIIQKPWEKTNVAIMLYGKEGCGKDIIYDFLREVVMGERCTFQTSDPENDIFGRFASGLVNKVLVQIDEVKSLHAHADKLKNIITCDTIRSEQKGVNTITVKNFANLIFTSNNDNALAVSTDARRFVLFRCSPKYTGDKTYFTELRKHMAKAEVARALYQFMMKRDLSIYADGFQEYRPITEFYKEAQRRSVSTTNNFLSACVNTLEACVEKLDEGVAKTIGGRKLYDRYRQFCLQSGLKQEFFKTENSFGADLSQVEGVSKKRSNKGIMYTLDRDVIKKYLVDAKEYNEDVFLRPDKDT